MLNKKEAGYLNICVKWMKFTGTKRQFAEAEGSSVHSVYKAIKWGEENGFFKEVAYNKVEQYRTEIVRTIKFLENRLSSWEHFIEFMEGENERIIRQIEEGEDEEARNIHLVPPGKYLPLVKELREQRLMLAELDGIVKRSNAIIDNRKQTNVFFLPSGSDAKEWEMEAKRFVESEQRLLPGDHDEPVEVDI